jgi:hypothetical protein
MMWLFLGEVAFNILKLMLILLYEKSSLPREMHFFLFSTKLEKYKNYGVANKFFETVHEYPYLLSTINYSLTYYTKFAIQLNKLIQFTKNLKK